MTQAFTRPKPNLALRTILYKGYGMYPALLKAHLNSLVVALYTTIELMIILTMKVTLNTLDPNDADFQLGEANTKNYIIIDKQFRVGSSA